MPRPGHELEATKLGIYKISYDYYFIRLTMTIMYALYELEAKRRNQLVTK